MKKSYGQIGVNNMLSQQELKTVVNLICKEQTELIKSKKYDSEEYLELEQIKVKLRSVLHKIRTSNSA